MSRLNVEAIRRLAANGKAEPILTPVHTTIIDLECPICLSFKPDIMLLHDMCLKIYCADCILHLIDDNKPCPLCKRTLLDVTIIEGDKIEQASTIRPVNSIIELAFKNARYECATCWSSDITREEAYTHPIRCELVRHVPPLHLPPPDVRRVERKEIVSNARPSSRTWASERLIVAGYDGKQIFSKSFRGNKTVSDVAAAVSKTTNKDTSSFKLYKFTHEMINPTTLIRDVATDAGPTYLTALPNDIQAHNKATHMHFVELGLPLGRQQPRPPQPPQPQAIPNHRPAGMSDDDSDEEFWP